MVFTDFDDELLNQGRRSLQKLALEKDEISDYEVRNEGSYVQMLFETDDSSRDYQIMVDIEGDEYVVSGNSWSDFSKDLENSDHRHSSGNRASLNKIYGAVLNEYETVTEMLE